MINLKKGETAFIKANQFTVGLGWDTRCDLDAHAYICTGTTSKLLSKIFSKKVEHIFYGNLRSIDGAVVHLGDNLTGEGDGDDEQIIINLDKLSENINRIRFAVDIFGGAESFFYVNGAYIRIVDNRTNEEICRYNLRTKGRWKTTCEFGSLIKNKGKWFFKADKE